MDNSRTSTALHRLALAVVAAVGAVLATSPANAFTFQDGQGNTIPKFDLEEQSRQFSKPQLDTSAAAQKGVELPFGGTLQFGVQRNGSPFSSPFGSNFNRSDNADRRHYERLFAPDSMKSLYD